MNRKNTQSHSVLKAAIQFGLENGVSKRKPEDIRAAIKAEEKKLKTNQKNAQPVSGKPASRALNLAPKHFG